MKRKTPVLMAAIAILITVTLLSVFLGRPNGKGTSETLTIGTPVNDTSTLIYIAYEKGYFKDEGLQVTLKNYQAGLPAAGAVVAGDVDVAVAAEFVFVNQALNKEDVRTFGTIAATNNNELVARKDRGIVQPADLKGKTVGLLRGSTSDFFLRTFLAFNDLPETAVKIVDVKPVKMAEALSKGAVDAVACFNPYVYEIKNRLGSGAVTWPLQHDQDYYFVLIAKSKFVDARPETIKKILRGLIRAEAFAKAHPRESQAILQRRLGHTPNEIAAMWRQNRFEVRLPQNLLLLMEDETRWLQQREGKDVIMPDYLSLVYRQGLDAVKPEAVGIIH